MTFVAAESIAAVALALRRSHPLAPARDVLDLTMQGLIDPIFPDPAALDTPLSGPLSPFGQIVVAAFDTGTTPLEWIQLTGPNSDPALRTALLGIWPIHVFPKFARRYSIRLA